MIDLLPTPIERFGGLALWIKREDQVHPRYGGNKPRKLRRILAEAQRQGARRLLTAGAAGSHHVLATALFGREAGLRVAALLLPQPRTDHAAEVLRAAVGQGVLPIVANAPGDVWRTARDLGDFFLIPPGGSNLAGTLASAEAVVEVREAVEQGWLPEPDVIVVAAGSGGTAAGLAAGAAACGLRSRVVGVAVARPAAAIRALVLGLAASAAARLGADPRSAVARVHIEDAFVGAGYGHGTAQGLAASRLASAAGLTLDPTYTAKAFAAALALEPRQTVLYWHTLSSAPMAPLLEGAPAESALAPALRGLLR